MIKLSVCQTSFFCCFTFTCWCWWWIRSPDFLWHFSHFCTTFVSLSLFCYCSIWISHFLLLLSLFRRWNYRLFSPSDEDETSSAQVCLCCDGGLRRRDTVVRALLQTTQTSAWRRERGAPVALTFLSFYDNKNSHFHHIYSFIFKRSTFYFYIKYPKKSCKKRTAVCFKDKCSAKNGTSWEEQEGEVTGTILFYFSCYFLLFLLYFSPTCHCQKMWTFVTFIFLTETN